MAKEFTCCEACGQKIMVYRRSVRKNHIPGLIILIDGKARRTTELGLSDGGRSDFTTLRFFGLIYRDLNLDRYKWMLTARGQLFLKGKKAIPKYLFIFNNKVERKSEEMVWIEDIHPEKIDFDTILKNAEPLKTFEKEGEKK